MILKLLEESAGC